MKLYDTLSGTKKSFAPADGKVKMYVCGVTPYAASHIGHAMFSVVFDVVRRYLEYRGYEVVHVQNFTDVDDKMIHAAQSMDIPMDELAERNIKAYLHETDDLNVLRANKYPRATHEMPKIVDMIAALIDKGNAYAVDGDVYFRVRSDEDYGKLSHRTPESLMAGARVEIDETKENPADFALWKSQKPGEPSWDSPWGPGRPGWHIECSAMSLTYLGETLDIHGGGQDLIFPHHENELAQSESYTGKTPFVRFWLHNGLLQLGEDKMSKSLGNIVSVREALERFSPDALRMFFLNSHYR
ncbi:MAG: cysteine--tRNA ligase, partial [Ardenticatenaceae bacterium]